MRTIYQLPRKRIDFRSRGWLRGANTDEDAEEENDEDQSLALSLHLGSIAILERVVQGYFATQFVGKRAGDYSSSDLRPELIPKES